MTLPTIWRRASFSVAEAADLLGVSEAMLRMWFVRSPTRDFLGAKTANRIFLSGVDIFHWALVRDLVGFGLPVRLALITAHLYASAAEYEMPRRECLVVRKQDAGTWLFEILDEPQPRATATLVIPFRRLADDIVERGTQLYLTEAA